VTFRRLSDALAAALPRLGRALSKVRLSGSAAFSCVPTTPHFNTLFLLDFRRLRVEARMCAALFCCHASLEEMIRELPPDAERKIEDLLFIGRKAPERRGD